VLDNYPIDPQLLSQLQLNMPVAREQMKQQHTPPLLLVLPQVRPLLARYARLFAPGLNVLSYNEIPENREVSIVPNVGRLHLQGRTLWPCCHGQVCYVDHSFHRLP
jgi:flagellar biosynthesis protein FlhA